MRAFKLARISRCALPAASSCAMLGALLVLLPGCPGAPPTIEGDKLLLAQSSGYLMEGRGKPERNPFYRAADKQPSRWPQWATLPPQSYLLNSAELKVDERAPNQWTIRAYGVCPGNPKSVFDTICLSLETAGWDMGERAYKPSKNVQGVRFPAEWNTTASKRGATPMHPLDRMRVRVPKYGGMGGYTYFEMEFTHGI
jgi:hypothetical protein